MYIHRAIILNTQYIKQIKQQQNLLFIGLLFMTSGLQLQWVPYEFCWCFLLTSENQIT